RFLSHLCRRWTASNMPKGPGWACPFRTTWCRRTAVTYGCRAGLVKAALSSLPCLFALETRGGRMNSQQPVIVYVEDDEPSIRVMKMIVERVMNLETIHILQSSPNFLQQVKTLGATPDLILMDIQMRPHDGFELLSMLRHDAQFR